MNRQDAKEKSEGKNERNHEVARMQLLFGLVGDARVLTLAAALVVVGCNWFSAVFHAYQAELFPTTARATGVSFIYAWSRASMVAINLFLPGLIARSSLAAVG